MDKKCAYPVLAPGDGVCFGFISSLVGFPRSAGIGVDGGVVCCRCAVIVGGGFGGEQILCTAKCGLTPFFGSGRSAVGRPDFSWGNPACGECNDKKFPAVVQQHVGNIKQEAHPQLPGGFHGEKRGARGRVRKSLNSQRTMACNPLSSAEVCAKLRGLTLRQGGART